jgi:hypothetical protein
MTGFKHIIFPIDFSAQSKIAARYVASYAPKWVQRGSDAVVASASEILRICKSCRSITRLAA